MVVESLDWPWWPDKEHPHKLEELEEELPERHSVVPERVQSKLKFEREVGQVLLQVHVEWVWRLLPDWPKEQVCVPLPA